MRFICLLLYSVLASATLVFDSGIESSLVVQTTNIYKGEYDCFPANFSGTARLMLLDIAVLNNGTEDVHLPVGLPLYYEFVDSANAINLSGNLTIDCLRDTDCHGSEPTYYLCDYYRLSPGCTYRRTGEADCQWIDVSNLSSQPYRFLLSLSPLGPGPVPEPNSTLIVAELNPLKLPAFNEHIIVRAVILILLFTIVNAWVAFEPLVAKHKA